jgi:rubrerythrin
MKERSTAFADRVANIILQTLLSKSFETITEMKEVINKVQEAAQQVQTLLVEEINERQEHHSKVIEQLTRQMEQDIAERDRRNAELEREVARLKTPQTKRFLERYEYMQRTLFPPYDPVLVETETCQNCGQGPIVMEAKSSFCPFCKKRVKARRR